MKLAAKFTILILGAIFVLFTVDTYLIVRRDIGMFDKDMQRDAIQFCERIEPQIEECFRQGGEEKVIQYLENLNASVSEFDVQDFEFFRVKWVVLDAESYERNRPMASKEVLEPAFDGRDWREYFSTPYEVQGKPYMLTYSKISVGNTRPVALEISEPVTHPGEIVQWYGRRIAILAGLTLLLGAVIVVWVGRELVGRPLKELLDKTRRIGQGDLTEPVKLARRDEFGALAISINSMCDQLADAKEKVEAETTARMAVMDQLRHADRLRTVGRLAAGIAHEIGTPLNVVGGRAEMIASGSLTGEDLKKSAQIIKTESDRIATIIRHVLDFARRNTPHRETADMRQLVEHAVDVLRPLAEKRQVEIVTEFDSETLTTNFDRGQMQQVLTNLIVNAVQSMPKGGKVLVKLTSQHVLPPQTEQASAGDYVLITIEDQGVGISAENVPLIFEPFFTTKDVGEGSGLGLSIVHGIVQEHGGWIDVQSVVDEGTRFVIYLPLEANA